MNEFTFEPVYSPWELALNHLHKGDTLDAQRFLALIENSEDVLADDAVLELEQRGIILDVSHLPKISGNKNTQARLDLEEKWIRSGNLKKNLDAGDPLCLFLDEVDAIEPADTEDLLKKILCGDETARQALMHTCLPTVLKCAEEFAGCGVLLLDLIQEGSLGLWQGILSYQNEEFEPYILWWIRQAMARAVTLQAQNNGIGANLAGQIERYQKADKKLLTELGRNPTELEISRELNITLEETCELAKMLRDIYDLSKIKNMSKPVEPSPDENQAVEDTAYYQQRERIDDMLSGLTEQEVQLVQMRYGLNGQLPVTIEQTARKLNMTIDEVISAEAAALEKMRRNG